MILAFDGPHVLDFKALDWNNNEHNFNSIDTTKWDTATALNIQMPMPVWDTNTGMGMLKPVLIPITWSVPPLLGSIRTSFGNLYKLVPCTFVGCELDPPTQVLIPICVMTYPVLITGICKTLLMTIRANTTIKWIEYHSYIYNKQFTA